MTRLDVFLVQSGWSESRAQAQALIAAGKVRVDGQVVRKAAYRLSEGAQVSVEEGRRFVSRGGEKLEAALKAFSVMVGGRICADVGASTGGFTDCLLQHGAQRVYAIDVGRELLHPLLRADERVVVMEGVNARYLAALPERVSLVTLDVSFISLRLLLPVVRGWMEEAGEVIALIKPQFEAGREAVARGQGVIRDARVHRRVLIEVLEFAQGQGYALQGVIRSPVASENAEFLAYLRTGGAGVEVEACLQQLA
uniref:rRNA methylase n=1 Tax=uncultured prokaryote TaxID=198431 RepID=H5SM09_9ZZZZ|nr:rRNA methylase [uncultured prokaryote]